MIAGCKALLNIILSDTLTEREKLFTHKPIDAYRLQRHALPLLEGATRAYTIEGTDIWYIQGSVKSYPLEQWAHSYTPYAVDIEHCSKLVIYLKDDSISALLYNSIKGLLLHGREVWIVDAHEQEKESQYYLYRVEQVEPFSPTLLQFMPIVDEDIERNVEDIPLEHGVRVVLIRTQPIAAN